MGIIHRVCAQLPNTLEIAERFRPQWSGVLTVDGKVVKVYDAVIERMDRSKLSDNEITWIHKQRWLVGVDHGTGDLPHHDLAEEEGRIEWVMYFRQLKAIGYPLTAVISDGNEDIPRAARFVYGPEIVHQLCTRHFVERLGSLLPPDDESHRAERQRIEALIIMIQRVIEADDIEAAAARLAELTTCRRTLRSPIATTMLQRFKASKDELCAHILHPELKLPHTNNDAENLIRQLNARLDHRTVHAPSLRSIVLQRVGASQAVHPVHGLLQGTEGPERKMSTPVGRSGHEAYRSDEAPKTTVIATWKLDATLLPPEPA